MSAGPVPSDRLVRRVSEQRTPRRWRSSRSTRSVHDHCCDRRSRPHPVGEAQREAQGLAPGRSRGRNPQRADRTNRDRPRRRRRRGDGVRDAGRGAGRQHRPQRRARRRLAGERPRHDDRPAVWIQSAGRPLRRPGGDRRRLRRRRRGRGRGDDEGADGRVDGRRQVRVPVRPQGRGPLHRARRARAAGHLGRADRRQVGHLARRHGPVRRPQPAARRHRHRRGTVRARDPAGARGRRRAGHHRRGAARDDGRVAGQAQAVVPARGGRRQGHGRQLVADHRRRRGAADHERGAGGRARA